MELKNMENITNPIKVESPPVKNLVLLPQQNVQEQATKDAQVKYLIVDTNINTGVRKMGYFYGPKATDKHEHSPLSAEKNDKFAKKLRLSSQNYKILTNSSKLVKKTTNSDSKKLVRKTLYKDNDIFSVENQLNQVRSLGIRDRCDVNSVDLFVNECKELGDANPILYYKKFGVVHTHLRKSDFCVIIMTRSQRRMLKTHPRRILVDGTHGSKKYDFEMMTLLVVNEYNNGYPVAFMLTNRRDREIFDVFFETIKEHNGVVASDVFMSDVGPAYYNAWTDQMGPVRTRLFCPHHVERAWMKHIYKIKQKNKRERVMRTCVDMRRETDEDLFNLKIQRATQQMLNDKDTKDFGEHFDKNYASNTKSWASCHMRGLGFNARMHIEPFHERIQYEHDGTKKVSRVDRTIHNLLHSVRDLDVVRLEDNHADEMMERHEESSRFDPLVRILDENVWLFDGRHAVERKFVTPKTCCWIVCPCCRICIHKYTCTCPDYLSNVTICKHIHYLDGDIERKNESKANYRFVIVNGNGRDVENLQNDIAPSLHDDDGGKIEIKDELMSFIQKYEVGSGGDDFVEANTSQETLNEEIDGDFLVDEKIDTKDNIFLNINNQNMSDFKSSP